MTKLGFIGLGRMGGNVCKQLIAQGYSLTVFDISEANMADFARSAKLASERKQIIEESELVFLSLPGSVQVEECIDEFISCGVEGKTIIDLSTSYPLSSQQLYKKVTQAGGKFADASLTGTPVHAAEGALIVTFGGDKETYEQCLPVISHFASRGVHYVGGPGAGNIAKLANNYLSIMYVALYSEIFPLAEELGFDTKKLFEIIGQSGVSCPMYTSNAAKIVDQTYDPSFSLDFALKDISYVKRLFDDKQLPSFVLDGGLNLLRLGHQKGYGNNDLSEMAKVMREIIQGD